MKSNVVLVVADTLRKDYSEGLDKLLDLGFVKYDYAFSTSPWTLPSHVSMFTGLFPSQHGVHEYFGLNDLVEDYGRLGKQAMSRFDNLTSLLMDEGYTTIGVTANWLITPIYGFNFDEFYFIPYPPLYVLNSELYNFIRSRFKESKLRLILDMAKKRMFKELGTMVMSYIDYYYLSRTLHKGCNLILKVLDKLDLSDQFFLFINEMEAHEPYSRDMTGWIGSISKYEYSFLKSVLYGLADDYTISHFKRYYPIHAKNSTSCVNKIITKLSRRTDLDKTLIIVTSDHGQHIGEQGRVGHGYYLSDELIRVPLYVKYPRDTRPDLKIKQQDVSLTAIYYLIKSIVYDETLILGDVILSESYGVQVPFKTVKSLFSIDEQALKRLYGYKVRISQGDGYIIYDVDRDEVIETKGHVDAEYVRKKLKEITNQ